MVLVKRQAFLNRWTGHDFLFLYRTGQALTIHLPDDLPNRHFIDLMTALVWELHVLGLSCEITVEPFQALSPWSLYEIGLKTGFHFPEVGSSPTWQELLPMSDACSDCRGRVQELLAARSPITLDLFRLEETCLIAWKREMRTPSSSRPSWPPFHHTIAVIKPSAPRSKLRLLAMKLARFRQVSSVTRHLRPHELAFIYSTAYGEAFTGELLSYHMSGSSEMILLASPNIVGKQAAVKSSIRQEAGVVNDRRNLIHFPDSLGDTYAIIAYLFGEDLLKELIVECYRSEGEVGPHE